MALWSHMRATSKVMRLSASSKIRRWRSALHRWPPARCREVHAVDEAAEKRRVGVGEGGKIGEHYVAAVHDGQGVEPLFLAENAGQPTIAEPAHEAVLRALDERKKFAGTARCKGVQVFELTRNDAIVEILEQ